MKYKNAWIFICLLLFSSVFASEQDSSKEFFSDKELESTIMFLEDSQKINELVSRLRAIRDARKIAGIDTAKKRESFNKSAFVFAFQKGVIQKGVQIQRDDFGSTEVFKDKLPINE